MSIILISLGIVVTVLVLVVIISILTGKWDNPPSPPWSINSGHQPDNKVDTNNPPTDTGTGSNKIEPYGYIKKSDANVAFEKIWKDIKKVNRNSKGQFVKGKDALEFLERDSVTGRFKKKNK